jgi:hypothetical protein
MMHSVFSRRNVGEFNTGAADLQRVKSRGAPKFYRPVAGYALFERDFVVHGSKDAGQFRKASERFGSGGEIYTTTIQ